MDYSHEPGTRPQRPGAPKIVRLFLLAAVLLIGCSGLAVVFLSGCLDNSEGGVDLYSAGTFYTFFCDKEDNEFSLLDGNGVEINSGPVNGSCKNLQDILMRNPKAVIRSPENSQHAATAGSAGSSSLAYLLDVGNYYAIQILDPSTNVFTEVDLPGGVNAAYPMSMAMTADGKSIWVVQIAIQQNNGGVPLQPPRITIMDTAAQAFTSSFSLPAGISPNTIRISPDGTTAYVSNDGAQFQGESGVPANSSLLVIDVASKTLVKTIATPTGAGPAVLTPDGLLLYTIENTNGVGGNALTVIDTTTLTVATSVALPNGAVKLFINPSGTRLYIFWSQGILVFDTATNQQVASIPTVGFSIRNNWAAFSPDDRSVWFCNCGYGSFYKVDQRSNQVIQTMMKPGLGVGFMFGWTQ